MEEQSDTPRTDAAFEAVDQDCKSQFEWDGWKFARDLERELATATRERDEARALNAKWAEKAEAWLATPEAAQRLDGYRDLAQQVATAQNERDEARAEVEGLRSALGFYSQPVRYDGPNQHPIPGDPYTAADSAYMNDVCRDGGEIARAALAATEAKP